MGRAFVGVSTSSSIDGIGGTFSSPPFSSSTAFIRHCLFVLGVESGVTFDSSVGGADVDTGRFPSTDNVERQRRVEKVR